MRRKKGTEDAPATGDARITPEEVQQVEFRLAFRGYNERDVDAFLDRITEGLSSYREELEGVRSGSGLPLAAVAGSTGDADAIVARARAEADEIVRRAQEQAAGIRAAAGAGSGDARGAVAPFLNKEREFLQSLGGLVQTHAEEIKQMVMAIRERAEASASSEAPRPAAPISSASRLRLSPQAASAAARPAVVQPADLEPASAAEIRERLQASEPPVEIGSGGGRGPRARGVPADRGRVRDRAGLLDRGGTRERTPRTLPARALLGRGLGEPVAGAGPAGSGSGLPEADPDRGAVDLEGLLERRTRCRPVDHVHGQRLGGDPSAVRPERLLGGALDTQTEHDAVADVEAGGLPRVLHGAHQLAGETLGTGARA